MHGLRAPPTGMVITVSRRTTRREREEFLSTLRACGWTGAELSDTPGWIAHSDGRIGWGADRRSAIIDARDTT